MEVIAFNLKQVSEPYVYEESRNYEGARKPSWTVSTNTTAIHLSDIFNRQCKYNHYLFHRQVQTCQRKGSSVCEKFMSNMNIHKKNFSLVEEIFASGRTDIYVVVMIKDSSYSGHVYTYRSSSNEALSILTGPRERVDADFIQCDIDEIVRCLLEGARRVSLIKGCDTLAATDHLVKDPTTESTVYLGIPTNIEISKFTLLE